MSVEELVEDIKRRKEEMKLTSKMISDASGVPKSTVDRILRGETRDPYAQSLLAIAYTVGYRFVNDNDPKEASSDGKLIVALERESRLKTVQHNTIIAEKDRVIEDKSKWVKFLAATSIAFALLLIVTWVGISMLMHYDLTHTGIGYFRG